jgi:hypothetical protein
MPKLLHVVHAEYANFSKCKTCYKPNIGREKKFVAYKKLRYFSITSKLQNVIYVSEDSQAHDITSFIWCGEWSHSAPFQW